MNDDKVFIGLKQINVKDVQVGLQKTIYFFKKLKRSYYWEKMLTWIVGHGSKAKCVDTY